MVSVFLFVGPVPFLPMEKSLTMTMVAEAFEGLGDAFIVVSTFSRIFEAVMRKGYPDDIPTYLMISGNCRVINT